MCFGVVMLSSQQCTPQHVVRMGCLLHCCLWSPHPSTIPSDADMPAHGQRCLGLSAFVQLLCFSLALSINRKSNSSQNRLQPDPIQAPGSRSAPSKQPSALHPPAARPARQHPPCSASIGSEQQAGNGTSQPCLSAELLLLLIRGNYY